LKKALITGVCGQDGTYLAELLLDKNYEVHGLTRSSDDKLPPNLRDRIQIQYGDLTDDSSIQRAMKAASPDEVYHLAGQSKVFGFTEDDFVTSINGTKSVLEAAFNLEKRPRVFYASSSEIFGDVETLPANEETPVHPINTYARSKAYSFQLMKSYRARGLFGSSGILFNHESPRRGENFVTQKIAKAAANIAAHSQDKLPLGALDSRRDWGFAGDYVEAMWRMLQAEKADDFVIATGTSHSVREFCEIAFAHAGLAYADHVVCDPNLVREKEIKETRGDASKAARVLGWKPRVGFEELVHMMVDAHR
jgi:GDPmannose 4,6-dehydratase